jgi:hypothetical protein
MISNFHCPPPLKKGQRGKENNLENEINFAVEELK